MIDPNFPVSHRNILMMTYASSVCLSVSDAQQGGPGQMGPNVPLADMTISQAFASAKDSFIKSMGNRDGGF